MAAAAPEEREEPSTAKPLPMAVPVDEDDTRGIFASQAMDRFSDDAEPVGSVEELDLDDVLEDDDARGRGLTKEDLANRLRKLRKS